MGHPGTALVWGCQRIGDVVMSIPALKILRQHAPHLCVRYVTSFQARDLVSLTGLVDEVRPVRLKGGIRNSFRWRRLRLEVRRGDYDRIFLFGKVNKYREKIADSGGVASITDQGQGHKAERSARTVISELGLRDVKIPSPEIPIPDNVRIIEKFRDVGLNLRENLYVVVHPGCNRIARKGTVSEKLWPGKKYGPLFAELSVHHPELKTVLVGSATEKSWIQGHVVDVLPVGVRSLNLVGKTSIRELLQLLKYASVLLSGDSGVMHLATMTATPMVTLFGPTNEQETGPYCAAERATKIRAVDLETAREDPRCMDRISVEEVFEALDTQMKRARG